jgi:hypothetical protein
MKRRNGRRLDADGSTLVGKEAFRPIRSAHCYNCGSSPVVAATGLCGPCTWGEADTAGGAWWDEETDDVAG